MQREKDRRFRARVKDAMNRFYSYRAGLLKNGSSILAVASFEDSEVAVFRLPTDGEFEYGVIFKQAGEFGIYSYFVFDTGNIADSYYRTDELFKERTSLAF